MGHRSIQRSLTALVCTALCLTSAGCDAVAGRARQLEPVRGPVIAVLAQLPSRIVLLEPDTLKRIGEVRLRSQSIGMTATEDTILTAQCGRPGDASDTRIGFIEPYAGRIDYLDLNILDPEEIWSAGDGWCLALNGLIDARGMRCERIDPESRTFTELAIPPAGQAGAGAASTIWVLQKAVFGERDTVTESFFIFESSGKPRVVTSETTATCDLCGFDDVVVSVEDHAGDTRLVRRDAKTGEMLGDAVIEDVASGPGCAWSADTVLVLANQAEGAGVKVTEIVLVDPTSLVVSGRIPVDGVGAVGPAGTGRMVVCEANGEVSVYDIATTERIATTRIGGPAEELVEVAYLSGR
ncbi:MAG: hypothetical protein CVT60_03910 [Actinobacteria bacterium HGW-Actinobacteria-10]|nr:MAG: hypothetical protein CVT60_03910 [Actinobacteria bacterium HGW-Actinobacteria-10]